MSIRTINHPDVQINEIDQSQITPAIVGTGVLVVGYAPDGTAYNPVEITSISDLETNYGKPENEAERYFYYACRDVISENGNLIAMRLPYANVMDANYKVLGLSLASSPATPYTDATFVSNYSVSLSAQLSAYSTGFQAITLAADTFTEAEYDGIKSGTYEGTYDYVIVNDIKSKNTGLRENEGIFVAVVDPIDGMLVQRVIAGTDNDPMNVIQGLDLNGTGFITSLSGTFIGNSVSETLMKYFPAVDFNDGGVSIDSTIFGKLTVVVCKTVSDSDFNSQLKVIPLEAFTGSITTSAINVSTGKSDYIGNIINENSNYIKFYKDKFTPTAYLGGTVSLYVAPQTIALLGFSASDSAKTIAGSLIPSQLDIAFDKVANINEYQIDVIADAGLSTISMFNAGISAEFNPLSGDMGTIESLDAVGEWRTVVEKYREFCQNIRKDCMAIVDVPRNLVIDNDQKKIRKTAPSNTFSNQINPALKYLTGINSSYVAVYSNWCRMIDDTFGVAFWLPETAKAAGIYVRNDRIGNYWDAPAGLNRGIIYGITDLAFNPKSKEEDQLYIKSFNYAKQYPVDGFVIEGQKTSQTKPSAFDRVNVRRLFLRLERAAYQVLRYFVDEPNNVVTRARVVDILDPIFRSIKSQGGIYDYKIVCDDSNNTSTVIENNELRVAIGIKAVRTAEFILVDFVNTKLDANFDEVL